MRALSACNLWLILVGPLLLASSGSVPSCPKLFEDVEDVEDVADDVAALQLTGDLHSRADTPKRGLGGEENGQIVERFSKLLQADQSQDSLSEFTRTHYITWKHRTAGKGPQPGFNNRLETLELSFVFALLLRRTLVIHDFMTEHKQGKMVPYTNFLNCSSSWPMKFSKDVSYKTEAMLPLRPDKDCDLDPFRFAADVQNSPEGTADMLRYNSDWGYFQVLFKREFLRPIISVLSQRFLFRQDFVQQVKDMLPPHYAAVHVRAGDLKGIPLVQCSDGQNCSSWADAVSRWELPQAIRVAYVATDSASHQNTRAVIEQLTAKGLEVWTLNNVLSAWQSARSLDGTSLSVVEQIVAMESTFFMPSFASSWDAEVLLRRLSAGKTDAECQFDMLGTKLRKRWCRWHGE